MTVEHAMSTRDRCGPTVERELRCAGRLVESTHCSNCGHIVELEQRVLPPAYLHDLRRRVAGKPARRLRRSRTDRRAFVWELPHAIVRQPLNIAREVPTIFKR